jgi:adenosylcobinamide hydrolase
VTAADDPAGPDGEFQAAVADGVCRFWRPHRSTRFLSTGFDGGECVASAAYNLTVPAGWGDDGRRDLRAYVSKRVAAAGFDDDGVRTDELTQTDESPALLTGVDQRHARVARPADDPSTAEGRDERGRRSEDRAERDRPVDRQVDGTVNLLVGVDRPLGPGALANLVSVVAEAKAATLLATVGVPGTTSDAVVVGCPPTDAPRGRPAAPFSGSATPVGAAVRACVRDALRVSLRSRYGPDVGDAPSSVAAAEYGVSTERTAAVSVPTER